MPRIVQVRSDTGERRRDARRSQDERDIRPQQTKPARFTASTKSAGTARNARFGPIPGGSGALRAAVSDSPAAGRPAARLNASCVMQDAQPSLSPASEIPRRGGVQSRAAPSPAVPERRRTRYSNSASSWSSRARPAASRRSTNARSKARSSPSNPSSQLAQLASPLGPPALDLGAHLLDRPRAGIRLGRGLAPDLPRGAALQPPPARLVFRQAPLGRGPLGDQPLLRGTLGSHPRQVGLPHLPLGRDPLVDPPRFRLVVVLEPRTFRRAPASLWNRLAILAALVDKEVPVAAPAHQQDGDQHGHDRHPEQQAAEHQRNRQDDLQQRQHGRFDGPPRAPVSAFRQPARRA